MSKYQILMTSSAKKELDRIPKKTSNLIVEAIGALADKPRPRGSLKLETVENQYRIRVGNYRIIYSIDDDVLTVLIIRVRDRKDTYQ